MQNAEFRRVLDIMKINYLVFCLCIVYSIKIKEQSMYLVSKY